jgi:hypothetical protein
MLVALMLYTVIAATTCKARRFSASAGGGMLSQEYNPVNKFGGMEIDDLSLDQQQQVMDLSSVMDAAAGSRLLLADPYSLT